MLSLGLRKQHAGSCSSAPPTNHSLPHPHFTPGPHCLLMFLPECPATTNTAFLFFPRDFLSRITHEARWLVCSLRPPQALSLLHVYLRCQTNRAIDLGYFCCLMSHLIPCPGIPEGNTPSSQPQVLTPTAFCIAVNSSDSSSPPPPAPGSDSPHAAVDSLLGWLF